MTRAALRFSDSLETDGGDLYWAESRPAEGGRTVVVRRSPAGEVSDVTPPGFDARTRVHEYGGGAYAVRDGEVFFANFADQRLYRHRPGEDPRPITPEPAAPGRHCATPTSPSATASSSASASGTASARCGTN